MFPDITLICVGHKKLEVLCAEESCFLLFINGVFVLFLKQQEVWRRGRRGNAREQNPEIWTAGDFWNNSKISLHLVTLDSSHMQTSVSLQEATPLKCILACWGLQFLKSPTFPKAVSMYTLSTTKKWTSKSHAKTLLEKKIYISPHKSPLYCSTGVCMS